MVSALVAIVSLSSFNNINRSSGTEQNTSSKTNETQTVLGETDQKSIEYENNIYSYDYFIVENLADLKVVANYEQNYSSEYIFNNYSCSYLTSAGFYTKEDTPLGLLIINYQQLSPKTASSLVNGYFSVNTLDTPLITDLPQKITPRLSIQTGPLLIVNSFPQNITLKSDGSDRRIVAAVSGENTAVFLVIYDINSVFSGPKLSDLPKIVEAISIKNSLNIADAINFDGGSASAFYTLGQSLKELTHVGSFICVN
jgi:exopolysaccharide biosynthesis protein